MMFRGDSGLLIMLWYAIENEESMFYREEELNWIKRVWKILQGRAGKAFLVETQPGHMGH